ncbi:MAG: polyprenyl synthetase family protein [SAR324 cluster bacterium]|nr:polyprenyl synthetase family protein [SAR324 cluster bacterium]
MNLTEILENIKDDLALVEERIAAQLNTEIPLLNEVGQYILESGGKRLRPAILIYAARLSGPPPDGVFTAAGALEFLHTATLLHDDVVDEADTRRAKKAARKVWGNAASVLVGDYLLATAFRSLTLLGNLEVLDTISQTTSQMAKGEILQLIRRYDSATEADYLAIIIHKTACLFAAAAKIGGALSGADAPVQDALYNYGNDLGIAFQIVDDALDYVEHREKVGKPLGIDLKEKKVTLPLSRLLEIASAKEQKRLRKMLAKETIEDDDVREVMALMKIHQVLPYTLKEAEKYAERAQSHLEGLPPRPERDILAQIAKLVVEREF